MLLTTVRNLEFNFLYHSIDGIILRIGHQSKLNFSGQSNKSANDDDKDSLLAVQDLRYAECYVSTIQ